MLANVRFFSSCSDFSSSYSNHSGSFSNASSDDQICSILESYGIGVCAIYEMLDECHPVCIDLATYFKDLKKRLILLEGNRETIATKEFDVVVILMSF